MKNNFRGVLLGAVVGGVCLLAGCGGDSFSGSSGSSSGTGTGTTGNGGTGTVTPVYSMGSGTGSSFQTGALGLSSTSLSAGGATSITANIVDQTGTLYTGGTVSVTFNSPCIAQGLATVAASGNSTAGSTAGTVSTSTGSASAVYTAKGCSGSDLISATATVSSASLTASGTVTVAAAAVGSMAFVSATPANINLKGTGSSGGSETSTVVFRVLDTSGGPRAGASVTFTLNTSVGGITFAPASGTTDANGQVQTIVSAGTVATTVRVTAATTAADGSTISTQSNALTVSTGIPTSQGISLSVQCPNVEAWDTDGVTVPVTVRMTDRFNNPVPDGTAANFRTTLGGIVSQCLTSTTATESGVCTVNWVSKDPRTNPITQLQNGRSPLLVSAIGEESFVDVNSNGIFDDPDNHVPPFDDLGEPFLNETEHYTGNPAVAVYDAGDQYIDFNSDGVRNGPDGEFHGVLCMRSATPPAFGSCAATKSLAIGSSNIIIMSGNHPNVTPTPAPPYTLPGTGLQVSFLIADDRGQQMPAGTTVAASMSSGTGTIVGPSSYTWPCVSAAGGSSFTFNLIPPVSNPTAGVLILTITTPGKIQTVFQYALTN